MGKNVAVYGRLTLRPRAPRIIVIGRIKRNDPMKRYARTFYCKGVGMWLVAKVLYPNFSVKRGFA